MNWHTGERVSSSESSSWLLGQPEATAKPPLKLGCLLTACKAGMRSYAGHVLSAAKLHAVKPCSSGSGWSLGIRNPEKDFAFHRLGTATKGSSPVKKDHLSPLQSCRGITASSRGTTASPIPYSNTLPPLGARAPPASLRHSRIVALGLLTGPGSRRSLTRRRAPAKGYFRQLALLPPLCLPPASHS